MFNESQNFSTEKSREKPIPKEALYTVNKSKQWVILVK